MLVMLNWRDFIAFSTVLDPAEEPLLVVRRRTVNSSENDTENLNLTLSVVVLLTAHCK